LKYKNNLDWNHAWGAAPANLIPRWILGVQPLKPGFEEILISPHPGGLDWARGRVPTIRGTVFVEFLKKNNCFELEVEIPANVKARVKVPAGEKVFLDDSEVSAAGEGDRMVLTSGPGRHRIRVEQIDN